MPLHEISVEKNFTLWLIRLTTEINKKTINWNSWLKPLNPRLGIPIETTITAKNYENGNTNQRALSNYLHFTADWDICPRFPALKIQNIENCNKQTLMGAVISQSIQRIRYGSDDRGIKVPFPAGARNLVSLTVYRPDMGHRASYVHSSVWDQAAKVATDLQPMSRFKYALGYI
jgi:hypothetical protein